jgi:peroxiredoxin
MSVSIGEIAPNFDLTSTEGCVLMLRDEVARTAVVLYFFSDPESERVHRDLKALAKGREMLARHSAKVLAVAPVPVDRLQELQRQLDLRFPLLRDDRGFAAHYGVAPSEERPPAPALVVVDRRQRVSWLANPVTSVEETLPQVDRVLGDLPSPTADYPRSVINRWIDRLVN